MDQFIASLPKSVLALVAILIGFVLIVANDPPKTVCDANLELFQQEQKEFLYSRTSKSGKDQPPLVKEMFANCQSGNGPGGCFEYFVRLKKMNQDLETIPRHCAETIATDDAIKTWLLGSLKIMAQIAWGDRGPASTTKRNAWFDTSDLVLYCDLKNNAIRIYGIEVFEKWRDEALNSLPDSEKYEGSQLLQRSLFATSCEAYR